MMRTLLSSPLGINTGSLSGTFTLMLFLFTSPIGFINDTYKWPDSAQVNDGESFDFIIIGSGAAGSTLAARLSENREWRILLIEAGGDPPAHSNVPGLALAMIGTKWDWKYPTVNDHYASQALKAGSIKLAAGKMLGGSTSINLMCYTQGAKGDYEEWLGRGNDGWGWSDVKPFFNIHESIDPNILKEKPHLTTEYGSVEGGIPIYKSDYPFIEFKENLKKAYKEINFPVNNNHFAGIDMIGSGEILSFIKGGLRYGTAKIFLKPAFERENLFVMKETMVQKINIEKEGGKYVAKGVTAQLKNGDSVKYYANKEVISSAGAIKTPQLLMLSGIGPKDELTKHKIKPIIEASGVGGNLQDHFMVPVFLSGKSLASAQSTYRNIINSIAQYITTKRGLLATNNFADYFAFFSKNETNTRPDYEAIHIYSPIGSALAALSCTAIYTYGDDSCQKLAKINDEKDVIIMHVAVLHPLSRGRVTLRSNKPDDNPNIEIGYYKDDRDLDSIGDGLQLINRLLESDSFKSMGYEIIDLKFKQCRGLVVASKEYWRCTALTAAATVYHPLGTAMMAPRSDPDAVVDRNLKVYGVDKLRVVDASVMPTSISGHTTAPTVMVAEKTAHNIKLEYAT